MGDGLLRPEKRPRNDDTALMQQRPEDCETSVFYVRLEWFFFGQARLKPKRFGYRTTDFSIDLEMRYRRCEAVSQAEAIHPDAHYEVE